MKWIVGILLFSLLAGCDDESSQFAAHTGVIQRHQVFEFGVRKKGDAIRHRFTIQNPSSKVIRIASIDSSCSCTTVGQLPSEILPGGTASVEVEARLDSETDEFGSQVLINCIDAEPIILSIRGKVIAPCPSRISIDNEGKDDLKGNRKFFVRSFGDRPIHILSVASTSDRINVTHQQSPNDPNDVEVTVDLDSRAPTGPFDGWLTIHTDDASTPEMRVRVEGYVAGPLSVEPRLLNAGLLTPGEPKSSTLIIRNRRDRKVSLIRARGMPEAAFSVGPISQSDPTTWSIPVTITDQFASRMLVGTVGLEANIDGETVSQTVDIYGMKRDGGTASPILPR